MMTSKKSKFAAVGMGAAALAMVATTSAMASAVTVSVGGSTAPGNHAVTASAGAVTFSALHGSTVVNMGCTSSSVPSSASNFTTSGTGVAQPATLGSVTFAGCTGPGGNMVVSQLSTWGLEVTGGATGGSTDVVTGDVTNVVAHVQTTPLASVCSFDVVGSASGSFSESAQALTVNETGYTGNLSLDNVSGCGGQLANGDPADFAATYTGVDAASGALLVS